MRPLLAASMIAVSFWGGCTPGRQNPGPDEPDMMQGEQMKPGTITISPSPVDLVVSGSDQTVRLTARSSNYGDVTKRATWVLSDNNLGMVKEGVVTIRGGLDRGGKAVVYANYGIQSGNAQINIKLIAPDLVDPSAPANPGGYFGGPDGGGKPSWVYPLPSTMVPRNHPQMNLQWNGVGSAQVYKVLIDSPTYQQSVYLGPASCPGSRCQFPLPDDRWLQMARSMAGNDAVVVLSASTGIGQAVGHADPIALSFSPEDVKGGLYYWSTTITGIYRVPIGAKTAQVFINQGNEFGCSGCHAVSRDGKKVALEFGSANGTGGGVVDGTDGTKYIIKPPMAGRWNLQTFSPRGDMLLVNWQQQGRVLNADTGQQIATFPERMAQPEWSPDGQNIVYVRYPGEGSGDEWMATNTGDILIMPWNDGKWGASQVIVQSKPNLEYHFYPTWTPDSKWIIFNTGKVPCGGFGGGGCNTYDPANTSLWIVKAQPGSTPIQLKRATHRDGSSTNWPRVAPFLQKNGSLVFFTFSAKFPYGFVKQGNNPQIWMAAVDLAKASAQPGEDPSYAPFWLTFQKPAENNHLGTWTSDVACVDDKQCPSEFQCVAGMCVPRNPG